MSGAADRPENIEDWTKEHVCHWLLSDLKVPQEYADRLYNEDVSGASLVCFQKNDLLDLGVKQGPAVQIVSNVRRLKQCFRRQHKEKATASGKDNQRSAKGRNDEEEPFETNTLTSSTSVSYPNSSRSVSPSAEVKTSTVVAEGEANPKLCTQKDCGGGGVEQTLENLQSLECKGIQNEAVERVPSPVKQGKGIYDNPAGSPETQEAVHGNVMKSQPLAVNPSKQTASNLEQQKCQPRAFDKSSVSHTYTQNDILPPETGPGNLLDPVHEYKLLANTANATESEVLRKFTNEVFRFAAACMNSRTNGTIHFGVGDAPDYAHGQIIGIRVPSPQKYIDEFDRRLPDCFPKNTSIARACIRPPTFVQVLHLEDTASDLCVIEVDVVPNYSETQEILFHTSMTSQDKQGKKCKEQCIFVRQGASSLNVLKNPGDQQNMIDDVKAWASARKSVEENDCQEPRQSNQGQRLKQLISHGRDTLADSLHNIVVTNRCPSNQLEHLHFLKELTLFAVLEFDPESELNGSCSFFRKDRTANLHYPRMYNTSDSASTIIAKLNLFRQPSWVFCNGRTDEESEDDKPLDSKDWFKKRAGEVQDLITFICSPEILQTDKLQIIFLLHSSVERISSPLLDTFCMIYQKLGGVENMMCICRDASVFNKWRDLVKTRCEIDITSNCVYELNLNEVNSTIMKMKGPQTLSASRYLPSFGSSSVLLTKKDEEQMTVLNILSENECENTEIELSNSFLEFKNKTEEDFYRGGKVTWWNFYLSEQPGCLPFIKRDKFEELYDLITPQEGYKTTCVIINLFHHPGCGGTTLAMHVLWTLRRKFRCAVLKNNEVQNIEIATQVTKLLTYGKGQQTSYVPVLLLVDDLEDVEDLHQCVLLAAHEKRNGGSLMFIILNCKRSQFPDICSKNSRIHNVFITNKLSPKEQSFFEQKLRDLKNNYEKPETFYAFMIMTNNFSEQYIEDIVHNTLVGLDITSKAGQLLSFLALLNTFVNGSSMSLSLCEEFVGIKNALWGKETLEEKMNPYFTLLICFSVEEYGTYQAVRFLHQMIADKCVKALTRKHNLKLSEITTNLLHCDLLYKSGMGKDILIQNVLSMLITRQQIELGAHKNTLFSPLIEKMQETEGTSQIKEVLIEATKRFEKNATVPQALARHFYITEKDFTSALAWAHDAQQKMYNSYNADTVGQVYKSHLKYEIELAERQCKILTPEDLERYLDLASKATKAFQDSQDLAHEDNSFDSSDQRNKKRQRTYNTSGYVGEIDVGMIIFSVLQKIPFFN